MNKKGQVSIQEAISRYRLTILGCIAGGLLFGNITGVIILGLVGFILDNSL